MNHSAADAAHPIGGLSTDAFSSMFQAISGLRNRRALFAMLGCLFAGVLAAGLLFLMATKMGFFMGFLGGLTFFIASATGVNAAGVLLMDQAKGVPARSLPDAVVYGLMCIPKFIVLGLALLLVSLVVFIAIALVYLVCKIPFIGPILFVVVFPLSVVVAGLTLCGLFQCLFLALPAIWEGSTITHAIAQALAIVRSRLVESMLLLTVVGFLAMGVGFIVFGVLISGLIPTTGMMAGILGGDGFGAVMGMVHGMGGDPDGPFGGGAYGGGLRGSRGSGGGGAGYAIAAGIGGGLLWALAASLVSLVYLLGLNLVYLRVTEGLDVGATEAAMKAGLDDAKRRAAELSQKAKEAAERAREQARQAAAAAQASAAPPPAAPVSAPPPAVSAPPAYSAAPGAGTSSPAIAKPCPKCLAPTGADDMFCGVCGNRLK